MPARHQKLGRAKIGQDLDTELLLSTPGPVQENVLLQDSAVSTAGHKFITVVLQMHCCSLGVGHVPLHSVPVDQFPNVVELPRPESGTVTEGTVQSMIPANTSRVDDLFVQLKLEVDHLTTTEQESLKSLLTSYSDVFAFTLSELGIYNICGDPLN